MNEPNREQSVLWNTAGGQTWVELQALLDRFLEPVATRVVEAGFPGEGGSALDIGCGAGATTLAMARRLGPAGGCVGVDISAPLVEAATRRAAAEGCASAAFLCADAQTHAFEPAAFDAVISRFGVMFFDDPTAAFANIRRGVRPGGQLAFAAWRSPAENPFMSAGARAVSPFLPPQPPADPDAPGQFAFARADRVCGILEGAGWTDVAVEPLDVPAALPRAQLITYVTRMGPAGQALQAMDEASRSRALDAVLAAFDPFMSDGVARFDMACWRVTGRA